MIIKGVPDSIDRKALSEALRTLGIDTTLVHKIVIGEEGTNQRGSSGVCVEVVTFTGLVNTVWIPLTGPY
jgi:hypothetical protein